jgi:F0F1-type ATP synthase alpha subunit
MTNDILNIHTPIVNYDIYNDKSKKINESELFEMGEVLSVGDGVATISGLTNVKAGEMVEFINSGI